jgi:predicted small lipoprotein YifL
MKQIYLTLFITMFVITGTSCGYKGDLYMHPKQPSKN